MAGPDPRMIQVPQPNSMQEEEPVAPIGSRFFGPVETAGVALKANELANDPNVPPELRLSLARRNPAPAGEVLGRLALEVGGVTAGSALAGRAYGGSKLAQGVLEARKAAEIGGRTSAEALDLARQARAAGIVGDVFEGGARSAGAALGAVGGAKTAGAENEELPTVAGFNAIGETGGRLATRAVNKLWSALPLTRMVVRPWIAKFRPGGESALDAMVKAGTVPPADVLIENALTDELGAAARVGLFSSSGYRRAQEAATRSASGNLDRFAEQLAGRAGKTEAEFVVQEALQNSDRIFRLGQKKLREGLVETAGPAVDVDMSRTLRAADNTRRTLGLRDPTVEKLANDVLRPSTVKTSVTDYVDMPGALEAKKVPRGIYDKKAPTGTTMEMGPPTREEIVSKGERAVNLRGGQVTFEEGFTLWSDLNAKAQTNNATGREARRLADTLEADLRRSAERRGDVFMRDFDQVVAFEKGGAEPFNKALLGKFIGAADPLKIADALRGRSPATIRGIREVVEKEIGAGRLDPRSWYSVQSFWTKNLLGDATVGDLDQIVSGKKLLQNLRQAERNGVLGEVFPNPKDQKELKTLGTVLAAVEKRPAETTGAVVIRLTQFGALINLATAPVRENSEGFWSAGSGTYGTIGSAAVLLGPSAMAAVLKNPRVVRALAYGSAAAPGSRQALHATSRFVAAIEEMKHNGLLTDDDVKYEGSANLAGSFYKGTRKPSDDPTLDAARRGSRE